MPDWLYDWTKAKLPPGACSQNSYSGLTQVELPPVNVTAVPAACGLAGVAETVAFVHVNAGPPASASVNEAHRPPVVPGSLNSVAVSQRAVFALHTNVWHMFG